MTRERSRKGQYRAMVTCGLVCIASGGHDSDQYIIRKTTVIVIIRVADEVALATDSSACGIQDPATHSPSTPKCIELAVLMPAG